MESISIAILRRDLAEIVAATFLGALGLAALALFAFRRRSSDTTLLAFCAFALMYSVRLLATTALVPYVIGGGEQAWVFFRSLLTYALLVPGVMFAEGLLGAGWHGSLRWVRRVTLVVAPAAILGMFVTGQPEWAMRVNSFVVLAFLAATALASLKRPTAPLIGFAPARIGLSVMAVFVVAENLRGMGLLPWPQGIEFVGMTIFVASLALAVGDRFLRTEGRLAAVDRELATARRIQQAILPAGVPALERFAIDVQYLPMTEVAGDFYDFLDVDIARGTILVADVSGHGVPAALIASMVKIAAASHSATTSDPGDLLTALSETLHGRLGGQFLTAMCVRLDAEHRQVRYAGAGHPPILHWRAAEAALAELPSAGIMIGLLPSKYESAQAPLAPGDRLLIYTDGVLEASNAAGEMFGEGRFQTLVAEHASRPGAELARHIIDEMIRWCDRRTGFEDDVTLLVVDVL
jgi:phosphoserine phosphatase RsbU/P